jgi:hypothetical protein
MKLTKPVEKMTMREILELFRKQSEPKFPLFFDKLVKYSAEQFGGEDG